LRDNCIKEWRPFSKEGGHYALVEFSLHFQGISLATAGRTAVRHVQMSPAELLKGP
jgi:hypothetical protein